MRIKKRIKKDFFKLKINCILISNIINHFNYGIEFVYLLDIVDIAMFMFTELNFKLKPKKNLLNHDVNMILNLKIYRLYLSLFKLAVSN